jgi:hypothetical protein
VGVDWSKIDAEREAVKSLMDLYDLAKRCQQLHEASDMPVPEPLKRFLGMSEQTGKGGAGKEEASISPPNYKPPSEASEDWISIAAADASVSAVALAILRRAGAMRPRDLNEAVLDILPEATAGSIANMGTRLQGTVIDRTEDGWKLLNPGAAGIIINGRLWGPDSAFATPDIAAHRRESILHILKSYPTGLQIVQIVEQLRKCSWVHAPVNKDLLKADMEVLQKQDKVRRRGNSKKWEVVREE